MSNRLDRVAYPFNLFAFRDEFRKHLNVIRDMSGGARINEPSGARGRIVGVGRLECKIYIGRRDGDIRLRVFRVLRVRFGFSIFLLLLLLLPRFHLARTFSFTSSPFRITLCMRMSLLMAI